MLPSFTFQVFIAQRSDDATTTYIANDDVRPGCVIVLQHALSGLFLGVSPDSSFSSMEQAPLQPFPEQCQPCWFVVDSFQLGDDGSPYICLQSVFSASFLSLHGGMPCVISGRNQPALDLHHTSRRSRSLNVTILTRDHSRSLYFGDIVQIYWPMQKKLLAIDREGHSVALPHSDQERVDVSVMWRLQPCQQSGPVIASRLNSTQPFVLQHLRSGIVIGCDGNSCALTNYAAGNSTQSLNFRSTTVSTASLFAGESLFIMASNSQPMALTCCCTPPSFKSPSPSDVCVVTHVSEVHYRVAVKILMRLRVIRAFRNRFSNPKRDLSSGSEIGDTSDIEEAFRWLGSLLDQSGISLPTYQDLMISSGVISTIMQLLDDIRLWLNERCAWPWPSRIVRLYRHISHLIEAACVDNSSAATALSPYWPDMIRFCGFGAGFAGALVVVFKAKPVVQDPKVLIQTMFERFQETQSPELVEAISLVTKYVDDNIEIKTVVLNMLLACDSSIPQLVIDKEGKVFCKSRKDVSVSASRTLPISHDPLNVSINSDSMTALSSWHLNVFINVTRLVIALATGSPIGIIRGLRRLTIINPFTFASITNVLMQDQAPCTIKSLLADILVYLFVKVDPIIQTPIVVRMFCAHEYAVMLDSPPEFDNIPSFSSMYAYGDGVTTLLLEAILRQLRNHRMGSIVAAAVDENKFTHSLLKLFLALLHTNVFGECGRKQIILCSNFLPSLMSMLYGPSDVPCVKAETRYENICEHEVMMAIKVLICHILSHFLDAWVNRLCTDFFDIASNQDAGSSNTSKFKISPFFFHRSKINPITDSSRLATPQEIYDAMLSDKHLPPFFTTSPESSKSIPLHDVIADLLRYHNQELRQASLRLGFKHIGLISTFYDTAPRVHYIQCREDAHLAALFSHTRLSLLHLSLDFENVALMSIALQYTTNTLHVLCGKPLVADGKELDLKLFKSVESRMSLAEAIGVFHHLFAAVEYFHSTPSLHNRETDMIEQFVGICYQILTIFSRSDAAKYELLNGSMISDSSILESWLPRIIHQIPTSAHAADLVCAILGDRLDIRLGVSASIIESLVSYLISPSLYVSQGAAKVIQALIVCKGVSVHLQQNKIFDCMQSNHTVRDRVAEISLEAEAATWSSAVELKADDSAVTRQLVNCNIVDVVAWLCSGANPTAAKHAKKFRKSWTLHALLTCRLLPLVSTNRGDGRLSGRMLQSYLLLLDVLYTSVDEMSHTVSEYKGISDLISSIAQKFVELFANLGSATEIQSQNFLLNTILPFMCHCLNYFPDVVNQHFGSQFSAMKAHAIQLIEHMSTTQQRNVRILFDIPAHALTRSNSSKNIPSVEQLDHATNANCFPSVLYSDVLMQTIAYMLHLKGIRNRDKSLKAYSSTRDLLLLFDAAAIHECYSSRCDRLDCIVRSLSSTVNATSSFQCMSKLLSALLLSLYLDPKRDLCQNIAKIAQGDRQPWKDSHAEVVFVTNFAQLGTLSLSLQALTSGDVDCELAALEYLTTISTRFNNQIHVCELLRRVCLQQEFRQVAVRHLRSGFSNVTTMLALSETCRLVNVSQSVVCRAPCYRAFSKIVHMLAILGSYNRATNSDTFSWRQGNMSNEPMIVEVASFMSNMIPFCARILDSAVASSFSAFPDEQFLSMMKCAVVAVAVDIDGHVGHKEQLLTTSVIVDICALLEELATFAAHCNSDHTLRQPVQALAVSCLQLLRILFSDDVPEAAFSLVRVPSIFKVVDALLKDIDGDRQSFILNDADNAFNFPVRYPAIVDALILLKHLHAHDSITSPILEQIMFRPALHAFSNVITSVVVAAPDKKSQVCVFFPISRAASVYLNSRRHRNSIETLVMEKGDQFHNQPKNVIRLIISACIDIQNRSRLLLLESLFGHRGFFVVNMCCILFLNFMLFFSTSTYSIWQQYFESHAAPAIWVAGCLHISVSILRLFKYVAFDFVSESLHNEIDPEKTSQSTRQQNLRNYHDGNSDYVITFTTSEIMSSYMFQRLKARVHGIQGMTAWCRVEVQFMSKTDAQQPYLSGCCTCRLGDVGEVEQVQLDIEGDSVLLSSVIIQKTDTGRCWKSSGNEVWLHPGSPIRVPVCVTFDYISAISNSLLVGVNYFRLISSPRLLLLIINVATSALGTFLYPMFFVLLMIDVTLHLPLVRHMLRFITSLCIWPLTQIVVLVMIIIFMLSAWMFVQFQDSVLDYGHK